MTSLFNSSISPLLDLSDVPDFTQVKASSVTAAIDHALAECRRTIERVLHPDNPVSFETVVEPMETMGHQLERVWSPVSHMNSVMNNDELREAHNDGLEKLTAFWSEVGQNADLYQAYKKIHELAQTSSIELDDAQVRLLDLALRNFTLAGVGLPAEQREQFTKIQLELSSLKSKFGENVLDCSNAWSYHATDEVELDGLPANVMQRAADEAADRKLEGWCFTLDFPTYLAVASHARNADLRKRFYDAWVTRASTAGEHDEKYDNTDIIRKILTLRQQAARLLNFSDYTELSLATKMADDAQQVEQFVRDLAKRSRAAAQLELDELTAFANVDELKPWDMTFYSERLREQKLEISDEALRPYFPLDKALDGLFKICGDIFDIRIEAAKATGAWHEDVRMYSVTSRDGELYGRFYTDLFARAKKRGGAWMDECIGHNRMGTQDTRAVAYLVCNFMPPEKDKPALLTHDEIVTLFHEFGHTLHLLLSKVAYPGVAGINGVPWDAVELPSQFLENFAWQSATLPLISEHYQSGSAMPGELFARLLESRTFHAGLQSLRQLEFALFDMRVHREDNADYEKILAEVRAEIAIVPTAPNNRFANAFSHIFAGGYAAGYYSYKWAEVLSADAFGAFEENGILDQATGDKFRSCILERGGSVDAMEAFKAFRGRQPSVDALIRHNGLDQVERAS